jgi:hypothetical protein
MLKAVTNTTTASKCFIATMAKVRASVCVECRGSDSEVTGNWLTAILFLFAGVSVVASKPEIVPTHVSLYGLSESSLTETTGNGLCYLNSGVAIRTVAIQNFDDRIGSISVGVSGVLL